MDQNYLNPPHPRLVMKVKSRLEELGIFFDDDSIAAIVAAYDEYIFETTDGREMAAQKFRFDWSLGQADMLYSIVSPDGSASKIKGDDVVFLKTCLIKGEFFPPHQVVEKAVDIENCEHCGQNLHCTRLVKDPDHKDKIRVCNHCLIYMQDIEGEESGGLEECLRCPNTTCESHPERDKTSNRLHPTRF